MADEVWVTEVGGSRIAQVPADAIVSLSRTESNGQTDTCSLVVKRLATMPDMSWVADLFTRVETELQVVEDDEVVFWGPVISLARTGAGESLTVSAAGADWWFGTELLPADENTWDSQWLTNPNFESGLDGWTTVGPGPVTNNTDQETGSFCIDLDGGAIDQDITFTLFPEWTVRVMARFWIGAGVAASERLLRLTSEGVDHNVAVNAPASELTAEEWGWLVRDVTLRDATGTPGTVFTVGLFGSSDDTVLVDRVVVQVAMPGLNPPGLAPFARALTPLLAWQSVINGLQAAKNINPVVDVSVPTAAMNAAWNRPDVFVAEAVRQIVTSAEGEWRMEYTATDRDAVLYAEVGDVIDPGVLTLEAGVNCGVGAWESGTDRPVTHWLVADEVGFVADYRDESAFGGLLFEQWSQAPTGTHSSELDKLAEQLAVDASPALTERLTLAVPSSVAAVLGWGDRVWLTVDDGPDQYDDWVRVESVQRTWGAAVAVVQVTGVWSGS